MKLKDKTILLISPESWGTNFVSKHHYAMNLSRLGNSVYFLNPPTGSFAKKEEAPGLWIVDYSPLFRGLGRMPAFMSAFFIRIEVRRLEALLNVRFELIWNFDSSRFFNLSAIPQRIFKICHLVDLNQNIQRPLLASTADICLGTTRYIVGELKRHNANSYQLGHAYQPPLQSYEPDFDMPGTNKIKALYVGNLSMKYIDWEILKEAAQSHPEVDFVFVGPEGKSNLTQEDRQSAIREEIKDLPNSYFSGTVHSMYIPGLLQKADILLIAYQEAYHKDQAAPHKMMEYLASGKPIVATYTEEFDDERYSGRLMMAKKNAEFPRLFEHFECSRSADIPEVPTYPDRIRAIEKLMDSDD